MLVLLLAEEAIEVAHTSANRWTGSTFYVCTFIFLPVLCAVIIKFLIFLYNDDDAYYYLFAMAKQCRRQYFHSEAMVFKQLPSG